MAKLLTLCILALTSVVSLGDIIHEYKLTLSAKVPRIYDNNDSLGRRKYQSQTIKGTMCIVYPDDCCDGTGRPTIEIVGLTNNTHKINGKKITYSVIVNNDGGSIGPITRVNLIGDNASGKFQTASVCFYMEAEPSYNLGDDTEDNTLLCTFAARGTTKLQTVTAWVEYEGKDSRGNPCTYMCKEKLGKYRIISKLSGNFAGTLGCGCRAYGHVSPTRVACALSPSDVVDDVASVFGTWRATYHTTYVK